MTIQTIADITPNGVAVPIGTAGRQASWIQFVATGTSIRVGDSNIGAARGLKVSATVPTLFPPVEFNMGRLDLGTVYVYGASGSDSVSVTYGC